MFVSFGCSNDPVLNTGDFGGYVELFEKEAERFGRPIRVTNLVVSISYELPQRVLGRCTYSNPRLIEINGNHWPDLTDEYRELLMFHELGHCVLDLHHVQDRVDIMNPAVPGTYRGNRDSLLAELFSINR
jgi:hypothetical protein